MQTLMAGILVNVLLAWSFAALPAPGGTPEDEVRGVIQRFEQGLKERDATKIEPLVAQDLVVFENGGRNDGWTDFRDHHLIPELREPAPPSKSELVKIVATPEMGWGYTRTELTLTRKNGQKANAVLWSVYVVEKREKGWKLTVLDWSLRVLPPAAGN